MKFLSCFTLNLSIATLSVLAKVIDGRSEQNLREKRDLQFRIIDGDRVPIGAYPWFAFPFFNLNGIDVDDELLNDDGFLRGGCGASLVAPDMLLTAAHCIEGLFEYAAVLGGFTIGQYCLENVTTNCGQFSEFHYVDAIYPHPDYTLYMGLPLNDFAIIKLVDNSTIDPVPLDQGSFSPFYDDDKKLWAIGFGNTDDLTLEPTRPSYLLHTKVRFVPPEICTEVWEEKFPAFDEAGVKFEEIDSVLCAGDERKGICQGDSGGPLYDEENDVIVGITSFSSLQCSELPSGFSNVSNAWPWIQNTICSNHGFNDTSNLCETYSQKECDEGESLVSIQIETNSLGNDCWWGLYNHDGDEVIAQGGEEYLSGSTYQYDFCLKGNECTALYFEGRETNSDSTIEVTMENETIRGSFVSDVTSREFLFENINCTADIPNPFSGAKWIGVNFPIRLILGCFLGAMVFV